MDEDKDVLAARHLKITLSTWNIVKSIEKLIDVGFKDEAKSILINHVGVMDKIK